MVLKHSLFVFQVLLHSRYLIFHLPMLTVEDSKRGMITRRKRVTQKSAVANIRPLDCIVMQAPKFLLVIMLVASSYSIFLTDKQPIEYHIAMYRKVHQIAVVLAHGFPIQTCTNRVSYLSLTLLMPHKANQPSHSLWPSATPFFSIHYHYNAG